MKCNPCSLNDLKSKILRVGISKSPGVRGFSKKNEDGDYEGMDVHLATCVAIAIYGPEKFADKIEFLETSSRERFEMLKNDEIDLLCRNTTWTHSRDNNDLTFCGINCYDGQGFMMHKGNEVKDTLEETLNGKRISVTRNTTTYDNLIDYIKEKKLSVTVIPHNSNGESIQRYVNNRSDVITSDKSALAGLRIDSGKPNDHILHPEVISKEPLGPVVKEGQDVLADIVRWVLNSQIECAENGINSQNIISRELSPSQQTYLSRAYLAQSESKNRWQTKETFDAIIALGNYNEMYDVYLKNILGEPTQNKPWNMGGLLYSPPNK